MYIVFNHIEKIQQKPEHVRKKIAFFVSLCLFLIVVFLWLFLDNLNVISEEYAKESADTPSPFTSASKVFENIFDDVRSKAKGVEDYLNI